MQYCPRKNRTRRQVKENTLAAVLLNPLSIFSDPIVLLPFVIDSAVQFSISCETRVHQAHRTRETLQTTFVIECIDDTHNVLIADWSTACTAKCCWCRCKCIRRHCQSGNIAITVDTIVAVAWWWHRWQRRQHRWRHIRCGQRWHFWWCHRGHVTGYCWFHFHVNWNTQQWKMENHLMKII